MIEGSFPGWTPVAGGPEHDGILESLARHLEAPLPDEVRLLRRDVSCYPRHELLRVRLEGPRGVRESYLLYAPDDPVPLDWTSTPIHELNPRALLIKNAADAEEYLRFFCFAIAGDEGRFFITERVEDLHLQPGAELDEATGARLREALHPVRLAEPAEDDEPWQYRFEAPVLYGDALFESTFLVDQSGQVVMVDDTPIAAELPVVEDELGSDRYFVLVRADGPGILPEEFLEQIRAGEPVEGVRVLGNVDARGQVFERPIDVSQVTFNGDLTWEGARFQCPVRLERCGVRGVLDLREAQSVGSFIGRRLSVGRDAVARPGGPAAFRASSLRVEGSLDLRGLRARGGLDLRGARIDGDLRLGGSDLAGWGEGAWDADPNLQPVALDLGGASIGGDLDFLELAPGQAAPAGEEPEPAEVPGFRDALTIVRGLLRATRLEVRGVVWAAGLRCHGHAWFDLAVLEGGFSADFSAGARLLCRGDLALPFSRVRGNVDVGGARVDGALQLFGAHLDGSVFCRCAMGASTGVEPRHAVIAGGLDISGIEADDVELEGAELGPVRMITGDVGRLRLLPGLEAVAGEEGIRWRLRPCRAASLLLQTATIRHAATFSHLHVRAVEGSGTTEGGDAEGVAELRQVECGGGIEFWTPRVLLQMGERPGPDAWLDGGPPEVHDLDSRFPRGLDLLGVRTGAELVLVNVKADGPVRINDGRIGHDLDLGARGPDPARCEGRTRTRCHGLELEATVVEGDADLSGLEVVRPDGTPAHVSARRFRVAGKVLFSRPLGPDPDDFEGMSDDPARRVEASISGRLDLSAAEASHLVISGHSFQDEHPDRGISFERGRFRRFQVVYPFPACHDPSDLTVERWEIPDHHLLSFLRSSVPLRRSTYIGVERVLRNEGNDELADEVYRRLRWRVIDESRPEAEAKDRTAPADAGPPAPRPRRPVSFLLRREVSRFLGRTIGWGTQNFKPLVAAALVFPISVWVFSNEANIVPTTALLEVTPGLAADARPGDQGVGWGVRDGAWLALRFQVPVVPVLARERWEPSRDPLRLALPGGERALVLPWISPEDYAFAVFLAHWIIWPLFLIGITTKVIRERA